MEPIKIPRRAEVADAIGTSDQYLYQIETRRRLASKLMAKAIEAATNGNLPASVVRPDLFPADAPSSPVPPAASEAASA